MSPGARKSRRCRSRKDGFKRRRPSAGLEPKKTVLIVGEGRETEPNYFRGLAKEEAVTDGFRVVVKKGIGFSAKDAVKRTIDLKKESDFDFVYCVVDVEGPHRRDADLREACELARKKKITLILSNPSFEVWFLAHFERTCQSFLTADHVIDALKPHWQRHCTQDYRKNDQGVYARLADRRMTAVANARAVRQQDHRNRPVKDSNSSTEVDTLVAHLLGPPEG
ncbi:MAG: RloB domain-containing protein [Chloroflexi bacterium]|nr:RloB domain-containing protein [Chloroflexota bacterium]